jgi:hypothetical protein
MLVSTGKQPVAVTFSVRPDYSGFTDQVLQLSAFYRLGTALGYTYVHERFEETRSQPAYLSLWARGLNRLNQNVRKVLGIRVPNVHDFMGVNAHMESISGTQQEKGRFREVEIPLGDAVLSEESIDDFEGLKRHVQTRIESTQTSAEKGLHVTFTLVGLRYRTFALINDATGVFSDTVDLRKAAGKALKRSLFDVKGKQLNIFVHMRQGDTCILQSPWGTWIPMDQRRSDWLEEYPSATAMEQANCFGIPTYLGLLQGISDYLVREDIPFSIRCFSDGFLWAIRSLKYHRERLGLSKDQVKALDHYTRQCDTQSFKSFADLPNCETIIGESAGKFMNLMASALEADVIITSTQQAMIQKFTAVYAYPVKPLIIVLQRNGSIPENTDLVRKSAQDYHYVDADNPDFEGIAQRLQSRIEEKRKRFGQGRPAGAH